MSSMTNRVQLGLLLASAALAAIPGAALAQSAPPSSAPTTQAPDPYEWDRARAALLSRPAAYGMQQQIQRWQMLTQSNRFSFADYAGFLLTNPGFPQETLLRGYAEAALDRETADPARVAAFFDRFPPQSNPARGQYAMALMALGRPQANEVARAAWRGGPLSDTTEQAISALLSRTLTRADHDARMNALLWANAAPQAERAVVLTDPANAPRFIARLGMINGRDPLAQGLTVDAGAQSDAGYLYNRARMLRTTGRVSEAVQLLASHPPLAAPPLDPRKWIGELLATARTADGVRAAQIAGTIDQTFAPGTDVSKQSFAIRDDYTSLMWLGGTKALAMGDGARAAPLFYRYGAAAQTPQTRTKGFYWAGRALSRGGDAAGARRYFEMAAEYPDQYYGQLALERLGRPMPSLAATPTQLPTPQQRAAFNAAPLTQAVREVAREADWPVSIRFFREIADQAQTEAEHVLVADLAREIGRRDLAVIVSQSAAAGGHNAFATIGFPTIPNPPGTDWTMVHAISRQESQFAMNAISHAGARGLMQLMPGTAREQAGKMYLSYSPDSLTTDAGYNMQLGGGYFGRMMDYFGGSYPLAVAAYNAGAGNVNKWLRANGDPRTGAVDWVEWIEQIPLSETRNYVQRVMENAVDYEALNPSRASYRGPNPLSHFLGKRTPG